MGCPKLTYQQNGPLLKCIWNKNCPEKSVQWFYTVDPLAEKAPSWSPYRAFFNNPIRFIDPDGMFEGDLYNQELNYLGSDGIDDGMKYVVTNNDDVEYVRSNFQNNKNTNISDLNSTPITLPSNEVIRAMGNAVERAENPSIVAGDTKGGFHEEGGNYGTDTMTGSLKVVEAKPGKANMEVTRGLGINCWDAKNPSDYSNYKPQGSFHVHPFGEGENGRLFGTEPSGADLTNARTISVSPYNVTGTSYVLAPRVDKVFLYNSNGNITNLPLNNFLNLSR